jgi:hypothetical protein
MKLTDIKGDHDSIHLGQTLIPGEPRLQGGKTVLQCGARPGVGWKKIFEKFQVNGYDTFHVLEIHQPNVKWLREQNNLSLPLVVHGDIRKIDTYTELLPTYDIVIFWHGIEHIQKKELYSTLVKVMEKTNCFIAGCPWGKWVQGAIKANPHEKHISHWYPEELEQFGFSQCFTFNAGSKGPGPDKHNVMYGVLFKDGWTTCKAHTGKISFKN